MNKEYGILPLREHMNQEDKLSQKKIERYYNLVVLAKDAKAYPNQSGYLVRTAGICEDGTIHLDGNALSDAYIHGETAVLSGLMDKTDSPVEAIAFYKDGPITIDGFGKPCGNCRDILLDCTNPDLVILTGNEKGFVYTRLRDLTFEAFTPLDLSKINPDEVYQGIKALKGAADEYLPKEKQQEKYGAVLVSEQGDMWFGASYTNSTFDAVSPVLSAIIGWYNNYFASCTSGEYPEESLYLSKLLLVGEGSAFHPLYRDRQAILELDEVLRSYTGNGPLRIEMVGIKNDQPIRAWKTTADEWLPYPSTPGAKGMKGIIEKKLDKLINQR